MLLLLFLVVILRGNSVRKGFIRLCIWLVFFVFLCSYFIETNGYYEYHLSRQKNLTHQQIQQFEKDVKDGKDIDLNSYLENDYVDYSNYLTRRTSDISLRLNDYLKRIIGNTFRVLERLVG